MSFARKTLKSLSTSVDTNGAYANLPTFSRSTLNPWFFPEFHGVCPRLKCRTLRLEIVGVYQIAPPMLTHVTQVWFDIVKLVQEEIIQVILLGPRCLQMHVLRRQL